MKEGLTAEQRCNYQLYDDISGSSAYKINVAKDHKINRYGEANSIIRKIGADGQIIKDIDFYHSGKDHSFPHAHTYDWTKDIPRSKYNIKRR